MYKSMTMHACTVTALCKDIQCKDILNVSTTPLGINPCILTALPLRIRTNPIRTISLGTKAVDTKSRELCGQSSKGQHMMTVLYIPGG